MFLSLTIVRKSFGWSSCRSQSPSNSWRRSVDVQVSIVLYLPHINVYYRTDLRLYHSRHALAHWDCLDVRQCIKIYIGQSLNLNMASVSSYCRSLLPIDYDLVLLIAFAVCPLKAICVVLVVSCLIFGTNMWYSGVSCYMLIVHVTGSNCRLICQVLCAYSSVTCFICISLKRVATTGCTLCPDTSSFSGSCSACTTSSDGCNVYCKDCTRKDQTKLSQVSVTNTQGGQYTVQNCNGSLEVANNDCTAALKPCSWFKWSRAGECSLNFLPSFEIGWLLCRWLGLLFLLPDLSLYLLAPLMLVMRMPCWELTIKHQIQFPSHRHWEDWRWKSWSPSNFIE